MSELWKCIDKINNQEKKQVPFFSAEFFPPRTETGAINLFSKFDRIAVGGPLFIDVTWGAGGGNPSDFNLCTGSFFVASAAVNYCGIPTMLHLTAVGNTKEQIRTILRKAQESGIRNILALRGDLPVNGYLNSEFEYATDLVKFIREEAGDYFGICVAGYPNGHPDATSLEEDLIHLKEKIDAGADFIITQLFFETNTFIDFVDRCRKIGITCPIIPGILPIQSYASLRHLVKLAKIKPPDYIINQLETNKDDDEAIRCFGVKYASKMCQEILESKCTLGLHFYTLNRETAMIEILQNLGMWNPSNTIKSKPWLMSANEKRANESTRPIFWNSRPKSYLMRTKDWAFASYLPHRDRAVSREQLSYSWVVKGKHSWDEFSNGRWGDSCSPSFGNLSEYYLFKPSSALTKNERIKMWGANLETSADIGTVFCNFILGKISRLPWSEDTVASETNKIQDNLLKLNNMGIFTTNSQPAVNGVSSSDSVNGWGGAGGYVYQKAYLEFFISPSLLQKLMNILQDYPSIHYHAISRSGQTLSNTDIRAVNAVTWGVFPGKEIIQPTVVDPESFHIWKDEAFEMWRDWASVYDKESTSYHIIDIIYNSYFLVNLVDNDYINGNIFAPFDHLYGH